MKPENRVCALASVLLAGLAACATTEPERCTADWIEWQKDKVFTDFTRQYRSEIRTLRNLEDDLQDPGLVAAIRIAGHARSIRDMTDTFANETLPDLRASLEPCLSTPMRTADLLADLLNRQGVEPTVIEWVQALGALIEADAPVEAQDP